MSRHIQSGIVGINHDPTTGGSSGVPAIAGTFAHDYANNFYYEKLGTQDNAWNQFNAKYTLLAQGRLTLQALGPPGLVPVSVPTTDITAATTLYYTPYIGDFISLRNTGAAGEPSITQPVQISASAASVSLAGTAANTNYDVFAFYDASTNLLKIELLAWTDNTTRAVELNIGLGIITKSTDSTRRYIGTIRTVAAGQCEDSLKRRFVWNLYNKVRRPIINLDPTASWSPNNNTVEPYDTQNKGTTIRVEVVMGVDTIFAPDDGYQGAHSIDLWASIAKFSDSAAGQADTYVTFGRDSTTTELTGVQRTTGQTQGAGISVSGIRSYLTEYVPLGYHFYQALQFGRSTATLFSGGLGGIAGSHWC